MEYDRVVSILDYIKKNIERWWLWVRKQKKQ
jgi:hypothetical protein